MFGSLVSGSFTGGMRASLGVSAALLAVTGPLSLRLGGRTGGSS
ncbi:hypothetical protein [Streptomyces leeuwenhoekii]|nr:hypothetical protein [Streptomyces leeuwenhoekii]